MAKHIKNARWDYDRDRNRALERFKIADPAAYALFCSAEVGLKSLGPPGTLYAKELDDLSAANSCLTIERQWLTAREIANKVYDGGYPMDSDRGLGYYVQNIGRHVERGNLQRVDGKIGKAEWKYPATE